MVVYSSYRMREGDNRIDRPDLPRRRKGVLAVLSHTRRYLSQALCVSAGLVVIKADRIGASNSLHRS